jgi:FAD dependent oxidoreductase
MAGGISAGHCDSSRTIPGGTMASPRVMIIGAGIVGSGLTDELTERGWTDVIVLEQGSLWAAGGCRDGGAAVRPGDEPPPQLTNPSRRSPPTVPRSGRSCTKPVPAGNESITLLTQPAAGR